MPYDGEFAQYKPLHRLAESERVKALMGQYRVRTRASDSSSAVQLTMADLQPSKWMPDLVLAVDGSYNLVEVKNGFPGAEAAYVTVASVLIDMAKMRQLDQQRPVDPQQFRTIEKTGSTDCALPSCNIVFEGEQSVKDSFRRAFFEILQNEQMLPGGETLLATYEALLKYKPSTQDQQCPCDECPLPDAKYQRSQGQYTCTCRLTHSLYSTDALRFHERMEAEGENGAIIGEVMQVLERLQVINILRTLESKGWLSTLQRLAIVLDGPLAVFGQPAWLSQAIYHELSRINQLAKLSYGCQDMLIIGIEKTGQFVDHLSSLDRDEDGNSGLFPKQRAGLLSDSYIKRNIIYSQGEKTYGEASYFGRKFFYKTSSSALIVASLPFLSASHKEIENADVSQFPRLIDAMSILDQLISSRYSNALAPLIAAHAEASIPANLGNKILKDLAKKLMQEVK